MACAHELRNAREPLKKTVCTHRCSYKTLSFQKMLLNA